MRGPRGSAAVAAAGLLGAVGGLSACAAHPAAFRPSGSLPTPAAAGQASLSAASRRAGIVFETALPVGAPQRAVVIGYEDYVRSRWAGRKILAPIRYFDTTVTGVYFGNGAAVSSCVDVSGRRHLEEVAEGRRADGTWFVTHVDTYPVTSSQGASCQ